MYRILIVLAGALLASPLLAAPTLVGEFYWMEGESNLPKVDLNSIKKTGSSTSWGYVVNCDEQQLDDKVITKQQNSSQGQSSSASSQATQPSRFFDCSQEGPSLTIKLRSGKSGTGTIKVTAVPTQEGQGNANEYFYYTVRVIREPTNLIEECVDWNCPLHTEFYMGYEGTSVSQVNQKGNVRFQYSAYSQIDPWKLHVYGDLMQTSVQEQSATQPACTAQTETEGCNLDATIAANIGFFNPLFEPVLGLKIGPMLEYNVQKLDSNDVFAKSYYAGARFAYNKIRFFSIGYGKSEGIPGERVEFTGQLPIYGEKLITGMVLNVSVDDTAEELGAAPGDSINIYIMTRIDFTKIFTSFAGY